MNGQVGTKLYDYLNQISGYKIIASDIGENRYNFSNYEKLDVTNRESITDVVKKHNINELYHLAAILSSAGEQNNQLAWEVNMNGLMNVLCVARDCKIKRF